jgi:hypothetical protein
MFVGERERVSKHSPLASAGMACAVLLFIFASIEARQDFAGDVQLLWVTSTLWVGPLRAWRRAEQRNWIPRPQGAIRTTWASMIKKSHSGLIVGRARVILRARSPHKL